MYELHVTFPQAEKTQQYSWTHEHLDEILKQAEMLGKDGARVKVREISILKNNPVIYTNYLRPV